MKKVLMILVVVSILFNLVGCFDNPRDIQAKDEKAINRLSDIRNQLAMLYADADGKYPSSLNLELIIKGGTVKMPDDNSKSFSVSSLLKDKDELIYFEGDKVFIKCGYNSIDSITNNKSNRVEVILTQDYSKDEIWYDVKLKGGSNYLGNKWGTF